MSENTHYELAVNVKDADGNFYEDCSIHDDMYDIEAIFYDSNVKDQTKVFAYIGVPKGANRENPVPAVVCVHGGAGMAFAEWVKLWNDRVYAAIAMTMTGDGPVRGITQANGYQYIEKRRHPYAGSGDFCWGDHAFDKDIEYASMYRNVLNVIRAHNVLRSYPGVDKDKIGITGISWGGITTTTTAGVDNRFIWAVPVYGAGYLYDSETYFRELFKKEHYIRDWDSANFAAESSVPTLYINGDSDMHFSLTSTSKTYEVTKKSWLSIRHDFVHGYGTGWAPDEIYRFADAMVAGNELPFIKITDVTVKNGALTAKLKCPEDKKVISVKTYYITTNEHLFNDGTEGIGWKSVSEYSLSGSGISVDLPAESTHCYATITDNNGSLISTPYVKVK